MIEKRTSAHLWDFKRLGLLSVIEDQNGPLSGLTLPGMIDEPGSFDGTIISAKDRCRSIAWKEVQPFASGGRLTGKLFAMADVGCLLFLIAPLSTILFPRVAPAIALTATLLCLPFYLYILMPGPYRRIFKGEYSVPLQRPFVWDNWAIVGVLSLVIAASLSLRNSWKERAHS